MRVRRKSKKINKSMLRDIGTWTRHSVSFAENEERKKKNCWNDKQKEKMPKANRSIIRGTAKHNGQQEATQ